MGKTTIKVTEIDSGDTSVKTKKTSKKATTVKTEKVAEVSSSTELAVVPPVEVLPSTVAEAPAPTEDDTTTKADSQKKSTKKDATKPEDTSDSSKEPKPAKEAKEDTKKETTEDSTGAKKTTPTKIEVSEVPATTTNADKTNTKPTTKTTPKANSSKKSKKAVAPQPAPMKLPLFRRIYVKVGYVLGAIVLVALIAFFARVAIWEHDYLNRMEGSERDTSNSLPVDSGEEETDNTEPTEAEIQEYVVAADKPRYFSIPSIGIHNSRILEVGIKGNGEMATPYNIYDIGWYIDSALPGNNGVSVMNGHGGAPGVGIFGNLPQVQNGAEIIIEMGDGRKFTYRVVDTATKALGDEANDYMANYAFSSPEPGVPSLTLITCTGDYWLSSRTYSHRFFARALLQ